MFATDFVVYDGKCLFDWTVIVEYKAEMQGRVIFGNRQQGYCLALATLMAKQTWLLLLMGNLTQKIRMNLAWVFILPDEQQEVFFFCLGIPWMEKKNIIATLLGQQKNPGCPSFPGNLLMRQYETLFREIAQPTNLGPFYSWGKHLSCTHYCCLVKEDTMLNFFISNKFLTKNLNQYFKKHPVKIVCVSLAKGKTTAAIDAVAKYQF